MNVGLSNEALTILIRGVLESRQIRWLKVQVGGVDNDRSALVWWRPEATTADDQWREIFTILGVLAGHGALAKAELHGGNLSLIVSLASFRDWVAKRITFEQFFKSCQMAERVMESGESGKRTAESAAASESAGGNETSGEVHQCVR